MRINTTVWFLRKFSIFRALESDSDFLNGRVNELDEKITSLEKNAESDKALIASLNRYIEALEGRDEERVKLIAELEENIRGYRKTIKELRKRLSVLLPREEETSS